MRAPDVEYPDRADFIIQMTRILKLARRPQPSHATGPGDLDDERWYQLHLLVERLVRNANFEYLERKEIRKELLDAVSSYRAMDPTKRPESREFSASTIDSIARDPTSGTVFLGIKHLRLPHDTKVGGAQFLDPTQDPDLLEAWTRLGTPVPMLVCAVDVTAGTTELLLDRAREKAATALALLRQQNLFGFVAKIYAEQVSYGLDGTWTWREETTGPTRGAGAWRVDRRPRPMDLTDPNTELWRAQLAELSNLYASVPTRLRHGVDTCIGWLDVAAMSSNWRIIIPAVFSGMEAILVPESIGLKAAVVTVRSAAIHIALDHGFFDPQTIMEGYRLRSDLIHGSQVDDIIAKDAIDFAERRRSWAFQVFSDYLHVIGIAGTDNEHELVSWLDEGKCIEICVWLEENGGTDIVAEYLSAIRKRA